MTRLHFSLENDRAAFRRELEARVTGTVVQLSAAVSVPKLAAPSAGRERLRRLTSSNVISRQHGTFSGNWSMHQETRGPYVKSFCIMQRD